MHRLHMVFQSHCHESDRMIPRAQSNVIFRFKLTYLWSWIEGIAFVKMIELIC